MILKLHFRKNNKTITMLIDSTSILDGENHDVCYEILLNKIHCLT